MAKRKEHCEISVNPSLLNVITPLGLGFERNRFVLGENSAKVYGVIQYPQKVDVGWLSKMTHIPSTIVTIGYQPTDNSALISAISKSIIQNRGTAESAKDPLTRQRAEKAANDGERIMLQIDQHGETVGLMNITVMPLADDEKGFSRVCRRMENTLSMLKCKVRTLANLQKEGFQHLSPTFPGNEQVENILNRIIPMSTFVGGFPFASSGFSDENGYYFAKDSHGGLVIVDTWHRGNDRTNSNFVIMGVAGVGKSTAVKHIALSEYFMGTKLIFIDPESEYKELCQSLNGDWINAGGGSNGMINPLQIRPAPRDEEGEKKPLYKDEGNGMSDMALHLKNLEIFFNLYIPDLTIMQKAVLKQCLIELYNQFHITWTTDITTLKNTDFPTFSDLFQLIRHKESTLEDEVYKELPLLLYDIANGGDSFLWNGHSTIETHSRCICLDTHTLQNTSDNIKRTQYFNLLSWCWEQMSKDRTERVLLICDESYLMIDPNVPQSLVFLRNVEKRARKYESGLAIISHSVVDFLAPEVKMYGQALLDIPCMKIIMGTDGKNLQETRELYNLTDAEEELLASKKRGHALFMIGSKRLHIHFDIPEYKFAYMGKAGGR
ncbi:MULTISPECIES: VirB4 family type IV secretion system protein [Paenibacillaceae]|uniref:VirB4 family type IV secretion system protein n=1 Tax=Paenibacillaceae TaxID=186822 RepID=UPI001B18924E|nr:type IV secretory system conjugative DNA transfer family protein [Paenibacillus sp. J22TS3]GIP20872.1 type VI secretion protein [Paenibacillus sp. J22TS3]